ncbi:MAG: CaiB/BaiF CoA transferase family protein [Candidatus Syntropharchaeia archaeon]
MRKPLEDVRVLDLSRILAGPYCTMLLGDMGAEVIKIEQPGIGDEARDFDPYSPIDKNRMFSGYFISLNRNKKSIVLDLSKEEGKKIFKELLRVSDVVIENYRPGVMEKFGLGYDVLKEINPRIIYASITGFGRDSPFRDRPAFDLVAQAMGGLMSVTGPYGGPPTKVGPGIGDIFPAILCAYGIMVALHEREKSKKGQYIEVSMYDSIVSLIYREVVIYDMTGEIPFPLGNKHPTLSPYSDFETKDGRIVIAVPTQKMWERFCRAIGREDLIDHPKLSTALDRVRNFEDFLKPIIDEWTKKRTKEEAVEHLLKHGVSAAPVNTVEDVFNCPHVKKRNMLPEVDHPVIGRVKMIGTPIKLSRTPGGIERRAPLLGEHTEEILSNLLGYDVQKINELREMGVIN